MAALAGISSLTRETDLERISRQKFDVLVIGGGIMGAGIALDAASRNLNVLLVEKQDFAAGTSSRSTKLIHGGLRYLKNFEFNLVATVAQERAILYKNAPHLVKPEPMLLPILKKTSFPVWAVAAGLTLYDWLGKVAPAERHKMLNRQKTLEREPLLKPEHVKGSGFFTEYRTDDARLTLEVLKTVQNLGATCLNYLELTGFQYTPEGKISGASVVDQLFGKQLNVAAHCVINATGPWSAATMQQDQAITEPLLFHTKGVHLVVPFEQLPLRQSVYFDIPGGRMLFAIPRGKITYLGTTDTPYQGPLENPEVSAEDVTYLLAAINQMFRISLTPENIISSWAGIRPLVYQKGKKPTDISRKDEVLISDSGLINVTGGKLTGYRHFAAEVVDKAVKLFFPENPKPSATQNLKLTAGNFDSPAAVATFLQELRNEQAYEVFPPEKIAYLVQTYGLFARHLLQTATEINPEISPEIRLLHAEIDYTIQAEGAITISDFLIRRTGKLYFDRENIPAILPDVVNRFQEKLAHPEARMQQQISDFEKRYAATTGFKSNKA